MQKTRGFALFAILSRELFRLFNQDAPGLNSDTFLSKTHIKRLSPSANKKSQNSYNSSFSIFWWRLNLTDEAIEALYKLCEGDMRKIVNMLQVFFFVNFWKN